MATGLATFDAFSWASLLAGQAVLVVDRDAPRARRTGAALEEAGATVTVALNQVTGADRARDEPFALIILALTSNEPLSARLAAELSRSPAAILLSDQQRQGGLRAQFPGARIGDHTLTDRDLVLFVIKATDE